MFLYEGIACPVCNEMFSEEDDVVSCPECGAPHHRGCWEKKGECQYSEQHGTEEQWARPVRPEKNHTNVCAQCGAVNQVEADHCAFCGGDMSGDVPPKNVNREQTAAQRVLPSVVSLEDPMGGVHPGERFGEVLAGDVALFVGRNTAHYMRQFWKIARNKAMGGFNFAALFFPGLWMLYRKMYKLGAVIAGVTVLLQLVMAYVQNTYFFPLLDGLYARSGFTADSAGDTEAFARLYNEVAKLGGQDTLIVLLPMLLLLVNLGIGITIACIGNKLYYGHCTKSVDVIRQTSADSEQFNATLTQRGGVNMAVVLSIAVCYIAVANIL